jgi:type IV pilus assembly protein PilA
MIKNNKNKGFTLIELMITVAIVGILSAVALPAYQDYTIRAQVTEAVSVASSAKVFVNDHFTDKGVFPIDNADVGYPGATGKYITDVQIQGGATGDVVTTFGGSSNVNLTGKTITLRATSNGTNLEWQCFSVDIEDRYLPTICR